MRTDIHGDVFAIDMPLDKNRHGPATGDEIHTMTYEVWDQVAQSICSCRNREDAELIARLINMRTGQ